VCDVQTPVTHRPPAKLMDSRKSHHKRPFPALPISLIRPHAPAAITPDLVASHGLKPDEYERILKLIGRVPSFTELGIFSAMWNEHCSYKSSRLHLRGLPTKAPWVIQGPGENAGVIDIGDGQAVVFKMESHNHPSYIEPYQGATTGVGGILRDVFTMGRAADRVPERALLWRAGASQDAASGVRRGRRRRRLRQLVRRAHRRRAGAFPHPLMTATSWSMRWRSASPTPTRSFMRRPPASTCRSSISAPRQAATAFMAPRWRRPNSTTTRPRKRPTVQVGDPFAEKLLLEACLEIMQADCVIAIQDMVRRD